MGALGVVLYIPVLLWLKDLSPKLRMMVMDSESTGEAFESGDLPHQEPASAMAVFGQLLGRWDVWVLVVGVVAFLTTAITIQTFGPLMFTEAYHYTPAAAAAMTANFWLFNLVMLVPAGWLSDYLRLRKPLSIFLTLLVLAILAWWALNFYPPLSPSTVGWVTLILGGVAAAAFIPWCALYSEFVEDISPALQATGWSFFQLIYRTWIAFSGPLLLAVAAHYGWQRWLDVMVGATVLFIVSLFALPGYWKPAGAAERPAQKPAAQAAGR
jgi:OPA family glycerol-3-phosphate transporter-like MFS transporter